MESISSGSVRLAHPSADDPVVALAIAECLSAAFSSGIWQEAPLPLGSSDDPASAVAIVEELVPRSVMVAATPIPGARVIGCAIGSVMDEDLIESYRLSGYAAEPGDGLLAFIGIVPEMQGRRYRSDGNGTLEAAPGGPSLARHLFESWIKDASGHECERLFIRTRRRIGPVRHLCDAYGFERLGEFEVDFRGQRQRRLVYCRASRRPSSS